MPEVERPPPATPLTYGSAPIDVQREAFSVDTGLFRELGELLVGRDSTALVELIKNAYDADAQIVTVVAQNLADAGTGLIVVSDDGHGMTLDQFRKGFLRVASRLKSDGPRRSPLYERRYTGAKGIGRLAAHKLARTVSVNSHAARKHVRHGDAERAAAQAVRATIDWDEVERHETLDNVGDAIELASDPPTAGGMPGTTISLSRLRRGWTDRERTTFVREVSTFQPGEALRFPIAPKHVAAELLFGAPETRDSMHDVGFAVSLGGEFDVGDEYSVNVLSAASWVVEVDAKKHIVEYAVVPTKRYAAEEGLPSDAVTATNRREVAGAEFQARLFVRTGAAPQGLSDAYGVRVYMEGFRVLPYGEPGDDWLDINSRYAQRGRGVPFSGAIGDERVEGVTDEDAGLIVPALRQVFGAVFLTESKAPTLRMLVNREGFVPDEAFFEIRDAVANAIALQTRVSAALRPNRREQGRDQPNGSDKRDGLRPSDGLESAQRPLDAALAEIKTVTADAQLGERLRARLEATSMELERARVEVLDEQTMLRVLASLGTQTAAFVHEINAALGSLVSLKRTVDAMVAQPPSRQQLVRLQRRVEALQRTIERQSAYLVEIVSPDARRRRSRRRYAEHFEIAALLLRLAADREEIEVSNRIPGQLKTPPMFPAEITSIFTNLLSNAIKAAGHGGTVEAAGASAGGSTVLRVQNTGQTVDVAEADHWFDPYQSTTAVVDPALGQGMGLGLTITRAMLAEYRGTVAFVAPIGPFAAAVEVRLPT
jgi:signal transduction histidine kinase